MMDHGVCRRALLAPFPGHLHSPHLFPCPLTPLRLCLIPRPAPCPAGRSPHVRRRAAARLCRRRRRRDLVLGLGARPGSARRRHRGRRPAHLGAALGGAAARSRRSRRGRRARVRPARDAAVLQRGRQLPGGGVGRRQCRACGGGVRGAAEPAGGQRVGHRPPGLPGTAGEEGGGRGSRGRLRVGCLGLWALTTCIPGSAGAVRVRGGGGGKRGGAAGRGCGMLGALGCINHLALLAEPVRREVRVGGDWRWCGGGGGDGASVGGWGGEGGAQECRTLA